MVFIYSFLLLAAGFALLIFAGDKLVDSSIELATRWRIPPAIVAVTIIAAGTSAPELVTSFMAALKQSTDVSVGNVIGSNIFNILAVGGLTLILQPKFDARGSLFSWQVLFLATLVFVFFMFDYSLGRTEGALLFVALNLFIGFSFYKNRKSSEEDKEYETVLGSTFKNLLGVATGLAGLLMGAQLALNGGIALGEWFGLSERVIGITIISVGTGLPELVTSVAAALRKHYDVAISNILGSNIFNTLGIPGVTATVFPMKVHTQLLDFDSYVMLAATVFVSFLFLAKNQHLRRIFGFLFVAGYVAYVGVLLIR